MHFSLLNRKTRDSSVTQEEFTAYYKNVGASIDDDDYFRQIITSAWNLENKSNAKGYGAHY